MNRRSFPRIFCVLLAGMMALRIDSAWAGELRILDSQGLIRAVSVIRERGSVEIVLQHEGPDQPEGELPVLTSQSGIASDVVAEALTADRFLFRGVSEGIWRIRLRDAHRVLREVRVTE